MPLQNLCSDLSFFQRLQLVGCRRSMLTRMREFHSPLACQCSSCSWSLLQVSLCWRPWQARGASTARPSTSLNEDNHCEILKYTCADVNGYWGAKSPDKAAAANVQFKVLLLMCLERGNGN